MELKFSSLNSPTQREDPVASDHAVSWRRGLARGAAGGDASEAPLQVNCADLSEELEPFLPMATLL